MLRRGSKGVRIVRRCEREARLGQLGERQVPVCKDLEDVFVDSSEEEETPVRRRVMDWGWWEVPRVGCQGVWELEWERKRESDGAREKSRGRVDEPSARSSRVLRGKRERDCVAEFRTYGYKV